MSDDDTPQDDRQELAALAADLEAVLRDLRSEIGPDRRRAPFGLPRPPEPGRVLQFADDVAIPATIAVLEANVKLLQALQRAIRMTESGRQVREEGTAMGERAADASRTTLDRLGSTLDDLQDATAGGGTADGPASELIDEARRLRDEIDDRLREAQAQGTTLDDFQEREDQGEGNPARNEPDGPEPEADPSDEEVHVDVEAELDSLKEQYDEDEGDESDSTGGKPGDGGTDDADGNGG